jgi:hypothetical protein
MKKTQKKPEPKRPQVVMVTWVDSASKDDWIPATDADKVVLGLIDSIGWLISQDKNYIRIATSVDVSDGMLGYVLIIPRIAIKRVRRIKL